MEINSGDIIGQVLREQGVQFLFTRCDQFDNGLKKCPTGSIAADSAGRGGSHGIEKQGGATRHRPACSGEVNYQNGGHRAPQLRYHFRAGKRIRGLPVGSSRAGVYRMSD